MKGGGYGVSSKKKDTRPSRMSQQAPQVNQFQQPENHD
jgi:hypothetical protein